MQRCSRSSLFKDEAGQDSVHAALQKLNSYVGFVDAILLDTFDPLYGGGSGKTFAWERILCMQNGLLNAAFPVCCRRSSDR